LNFELLDRANDITIGYDVAMPERRIKRALISVYDKTGIVDFARVLVSEFGIEIISTGGTASLLKENGIPVTLVETITGFPEMLDGRVKTLHPKIHAAILADRDNPDHMRQLKEQGIEPIDMVVVNLYPFEKTVADPNCTFEQAIEMIDIGGPCLLRAAAKNAKWVLALDDPEAYEPILNYLRGNRSDDLHLVEALQTFKGTTRYDGEIVRWFSDLDFDINSLPTRFIEVESWGPLRYGENPHQESELLNFGYDDINLTTADASNLSSKEMSFNNYLDANAALDMCEELHRGFQGQNACVFVKHTNPCGASVSVDPIEAYRLAYLADSNAAMGGILAVNFTVNADFAELVLDSLNKWGRNAGAGAFFVEVWLAPEFTEDAVKIIRTRKQWGEAVRLLDVFGIGNPADNEVEVHDLRSIRGGFLVQERDKVGLNVDQWRVVTKRKPTESEISDLRLAWLIAKHTKSNAISICKDGMLIGNGAGQMSRVMSCRIATWLAKENGHADKLPGSVAASDAFFPFADGPNLLMDAGVTAIIQPGGSKRDEEVIAACDARNVAMIFTGTRHFRH